VRCKDLQSKPGLVQLQSANVGVNYKTNYGEAVQLH